MCFGITRGEVTGRIDVNFWRLTPLFYARFSTPRFPAAALGRVVKLVQYGSSSLANEEPIGVPMLRMNNLQNDGWDLRELKYIQMSKEELERYRLEPGDLLFNRTNSKELVGKCDVFMEPGDWVFASYLIRVRVNAAEALPQFVSDFLNTSAGRLQIDRLSRQIIGMTNINAEELREILIPLPTDTKEQASFVAAMDTARAARRAKLAEADILLAGLDAFVLSILGLTPPSKDNRKTFATRLSDIGGRVDADFHSPKFRAIREAIEHGIYPAEPLDELCCRFETGFAAGKQDQAFNYDLGAPHLRPLNLSIYGEISLEGTKFVPKVNLVKDDYCQKGEVLFNNTNSAELVGKSAVFDLDKPCACSNHMTRLGVREGISAEYLAALFNALRSTGYLGLLSTKFNNQAGINLDTLKPLLVPSPPEDIQKEIAAEAHRRRAEARHIRAEAERDWQAAKHWFEEQLLGTTQS